MTDQTLSSSNYRYLRKLWRYNIVSQSYVTIFLPVVLLLLIHINSSIYTLLRSTSIDMFVTTHLQCSFDCVACININTQDETETESGTQSSSLRSQYFDCHLCPLYRYLRENSNLAVLHVYLLDCYHDHPVSLKCVVLNSFSFKINIPSVPLTFLFLCFTIILPLAISSKSNTSTFFSILGVLGNAAQPKVDKLSSSVT